MAVYLLLVHVWSLTLYPLGRDYALIANPSAEPWPVSWLLGLEVEHFDASLIPYHVVNLALLYGCMVALFFFTRLAVGGPWWHGSLCAVLFMANPLKSEAVLHLTGISELLPTFLALLALTLYGASVRWRRLPLTLSVWISFGAAVLPFFANLPLFLVVLLYEGVLRRQGPPKIARLVGPAVLTLAGVWIHRELLAGTYPTLSTELLPFLYIVYPIGLLPATVHFYAAYPWLAYAVGLLVIAGLVLIIRKARHPGILFGLLGAAAMRLTDHGDPIDPVHLIGGGRMLTGIALANIAVVALCHRVGQHPKWHQPVVILTTLLCIVFFGIQIRAISAWREAGNLVREFQVAAAQAVLEPVAVLPDYRYHQGAPVELHASIEHDTPFSNRVEAVHLLALHYGKADSQTVTIDTYGPEGAEITVRNDCIEGVLPAARGVPVTGQQRTEHGFTYTVVEVTADSMRLRIEPVEAPFPPQRIDFE